uniref:C-type lectin domain-containing protein n=1 Tax=Acrobeloides nanus TaxID=290746 RepID=A0A914CXR3_9BILA
MITYGSSDYANFPIAGTCEFSGATYPKVTEIVRGTRAAATIIGLFLYVPITMKLRHVVLANAQYSNLSHAQIKNLIRYNIIASSTTKYPVMVWIHGGGLTQGNGQVDIPGAVRNLVSRGVVLVVLQYRLGHLDLFHQAIMESGNVLTCMENTYGPTYINQNMAYRACNFTTYEWNKGNYSTVKNCLYNMDLQTALGYQAVRTGFLFTGPASRDIQYHLMKNNHNVYVYEFTYYSFLDQTPPLNVNLSGYQPVRHGAETGFIFMPKWNVYQANGQLNQSDINIANFFGESWTNFAKYGKPALNNTWKPANATGNNTVYYEIDPCWNPTQYSQGKANPKKCYKIVVNATLTQAEAENDCVKYRGILVSIDNAFENNELAGVNCSYFIGLVDKTGKGTTWTWLNGDTSTYRNWNSGYPQIPQGYTDYNVTVLNPSNGGWQNQQKDTQACYICQNAWVIS